PPRAHAGAEPVDAALSGTGHLRAPPRTPWRATLRRRRDLARTRFRPRESSARARTRRRNRRRHRARLAADAGTLYVEIRSGQRGDRLVREVGLRTHDN